MIGHQKTATVAIATVIMSLVGIILLTSISGGDKLPPRLIRFVLTCVFAVFLWKGANWARWLIGILSAIGSVAGLIGLVGLANSEVSVFSVVGIWMGVLIVFHGWVAYTLLLDKDVNVHFGGGSRF